MGIWRSVSVAPAKARPSADMRANASAALAAVLFGVSVVAVTVAVRDVPPVSLAVLRFGQGGLLLAAILLVVGPRYLRTRWDRLLLFGLLGLVLFVLFPLTFNIGLEYTEASRGAVMLATMPVWSALLGRVIGERLARRQVVGVGFSVAGIALAFLDPGRAVGGDAMSLVGDGLLLLTGLLGALYGLIAKRVLAVDHAATVTTYDADRHGHPAAGGPCRGPDPGDRAAGWAVARRGRVPRRAGRRRRVHAVDLGAVPPDAHAGRGLRHRRAARQLARRPDLKRRAPGPRRQSTPGTQTRTSSPCWAPRSGGVGVLVRRRRCGRRGARGGRWSAGVGRRWRDPRPAAGRRRRWLRCARVPRRRLRRVPGWWRRRGHGRRRLRRGRVRPRRRPGCARRPPAPRGRRSAPGGGGRSRAPARRPGPRRRGVGT